MNGNLPKFNSSNLGTSVCVYLERVNNWIECFDSKIYLGVIKYDDNCNIYNFTETVLLVVEDLSLIITMMNMHIFHRIF